MAAPDKAATAFRTIGEVSRDTGVAQHILRYWETRFPQLRPLQRAGNRRYYRPEDAALVRRIRTLLEAEGYTIRGVQKLLADEGSALPAGSPAGPRTTALATIRDTLTRALADSAPHRS
ncbi:MerR family transcriptional regulator [Sphingomonas sp. Leaf33]|uniref:MerR family transcriptional regulator n=1 Tax=Sphingomonas sp. Leaf33 TaxID=1736215 RepID=UPI0006F7EAAB|nr:MerR family transcriptional regulator [Sphingomonas sp. Leaf33]KQN25470.1 MerR family transcriptional regulator [Sphingomonas sp. Leaf33]